MEPLETNFAGIEKAVRSVVGKRLDKGEALTPEVPLISSGIIDSLDLATLIAALEKEFAIRISYELFQDPARFETLRTISQLIEDARKQGGIKAAAPAAPSAEGGTKSGFGGFLGKLFSKKP